MDDVNVDHEVSDAGYSSWVRVMGSVSYTGRIALLLLMGFISDVNSRVRFNYSVTMRHE